MNPIPEPQKAKLVRILHQLDDHVDALIDVLSGTTIRGGARQRLLDHIQQEEAQNLQEIQGMRGEGAEGTAPALDTLWYHSQLVTDIAKGQEMDSPMALKLLTHFAEEHEWLFDALGVQPERRGAPPRANRWTVGSLMEGM
jgi:hypothetical protein